MKLIHVELTCLNLSASKKWPIQCHSSVHGVLVGKLNVSKPAKTRLVNSGGVGNVLYSYTVNFYWKFGLQYLLYESTWQCTCLSILQSLNNSHCQNKSIYGVAIYISSYKVELVKINPCNTKSLPFGMSCKLVTQYSNTTDWATSMEMGLQLLCSSSIINLQMYYMAVLNTVTALRIDHTPIILLHIICIMCDMMKCTATDMQIRT